MADQQALEPESRDNLAWVTQTTLSVDDTHHIVEALKQKLIRRTDDDQRVNEGGHLLHRLLAVGGGVADVVLVRRPAAQGLDHPGGGYRADRGAGAREPRQPRLGDPDQWPTSST
jgi:hypothetical protein